MPQLVQSCWYDVDLVMCTRHKCEWKLPMICQGFSLSKVPIVYNTNTSADRMSQIYETSPPPLSEKDAMNSVEPTWTNSKDTWKLDHFQPTSGQLP